MIRYIFLSQNIYRLIVFIKYHLRFASKTILQAECSNLSVESSLNKIITNVQGNKFCIASLERILQEFLLN